MNITSFITKLILIILALCQAQLNNEFDLYYSLTSKNLHDSMYEKFMVHLDPSKLTRNFVNCSLNNGV